MFEPSVESYWGQHLTYFEIASKWEAQPSVWLQWISLSMLVLECSCALVPRGIKVRLGQYRLPRPWAVATMSVGRCWAMATVLAIDHPCSVPLIYLCTWQATSWTVILSTWWKRWPPQDGKERLCSRADGAARARGLFVDFPLAMCGYKHRIMNTNEHWTCQFYPTSQHWAPLTLPLLHPTTSSFLMGSGASTFDGGPNDSSFWNGEMPMQDDWNGGTFQLVTFSEWIFLTRDDTFRYLC